MSRLHSRRGVLARSLRRGRLGRLGRLIPWRGADRPKIDLSDESFLTEGLRLASRLERLRGDVCSPHHPADARGMQCERNEEPSHRHEVCPESGRHAAQAQHILHVEQPAGMRGQKPAGAQAALGVVCPAR